MSVNRQPLAALLVLGAWSAHAQAPAETERLEPDAAALPASATSRTAGPRLAPSESIPPAELEALVDGIVELGMDAAHVAGATVSIVQDGRIVLEKGYGFASFDPVRRVDPATTLFRIGSITKTFTWIEVMRLVEAGRLDLEAPVNRYLPADLQIPAQGFEREIRMRDLMTHSPGFEDRVLGVLFAADPERVLPLREFLARYRPRRVREPGELTSYSNYGVALAGAIVSEIEGVEWQDLVERDVIRPLGLTHVTGREPYPARDGLPAPMPDDLARDLSEPFRWNGVAHEKRGFEYVSQVAPAGSMSASARDMARYMLLLLGDGTLDGVTVYGPVAARAFRTPLTTLPPEIGALDAGFFDNLLPGGFHGYGHGGATLSFFSNMTVVPDLRLGVFISTNTAGGGQLIGPFPTRIVEHFYATAREPPAPAGGLDVAEAARVYAGVYAPTRRRYEGLEGFVMRFFGTSVSVSPEGYLLSGSPPQRFVPTGRPDEFRSVSGPSGAPNVLVFQRDGERAVSIAAIPVAAERVRPLYDRTTMLALAALTLFTSVAIVIGAFLRLAHKPGASRGQRLAGRVQLTAALLWLASFGGAAAFAAGASDDANLVMHWPGGAILAASTAALLASLTTLACALLLRAAWRGANGSSATAAGWSTWRKLRYTLALAIFAAYAILLGAWGALAPWRY
jgi:CubicO group peptidase (beta-lactamase class C family)